MAKTAELIVDGKSYKFPIVEGTEHEMAIDISNLLEEAGLITLDLGYKNTGATKSAITFLDGDKGILRYRGYAIEDLAAHSNFLEVAYLLIFGELPTAEQYQKFTDDIKMHTMVHEDTRKILDGFPSSAHPMGVLASMFCAQTAFYPEALDPNRSSEAVYLSIVRSLAKMPTFAAWAYKNAVGHPVNYPDNSLDYCARFMKMLYALPAEQYEIDPVVADALDKLLILHADHEQNCSTSTVRIVGSSKASIYSSISAGINALWGPLHGGANQEVIVMLENIRKDGGDTDKWIAKAKDKNSGFRLMGFGHRVYKNFDPRAKIIKKAADDVLKKLGVNDPVLDIAMKLEEVALRDSYFIERKLYPNVDFYSGIIYRALGIPVDMFTVMFAMGRLPGWIAQWKELRENKEPIGRPRQVYTGQNLRPYVPIKKR
jgi:citrate synthase